MPKPVYMLCSESGATDQESGLVSHFKVLDVLQINRKPFKVPKEHGVVIVPTELMRFQVVALWEQEDKDSSDTEFEMEMAFKRPERESEDIVHKTKFKFSRRRQRFTINVGFVPHENPQSGFFYTECRIRRVGTKAWLRQSYSVEQKVVESLERDASNNGKKPSRRRKKGSR